MDKKKFLFLDLDGTIIETASGETFPKGIYDMKFKDGILQAISDFVSLNKKDFRAIFICSNQGGIELGYVNKESLEIKLKYIIRCITEYIHTMTGKHIPVYGQYCATNEKTCWNRKPNIGMFSNAFRSYALGELGESLDLSDYVKDCLAVGDASGLSGQFSDSDKVAAEKLGMDYMDVSEFIEMHRTPLDHLL